jgi:hypothetical protein
MYSTPIFTVSSPENGKLYLEFDNPKDTLITDALLNFLSLQANFRNVDAAKDIWFFSSCYAKLLNLDVNNY